MPELGVPYERVSVGTSDSLELAAYYVPSQNRAAVVLYPGATRPEQARMLSVTDTVCHPCASESEIRPRPHQAYALNVAGLRGGGARDHASHRFVKTGPDCHIAHADRSPTNRRKQRSLSGAA